LLFQVGFFKNWFAENPTTSLTLSLWFRYTGQGEEFEGLFSNGDCVDDASLLLAVGSGVAQGQIIAGSTAHFGFHNHARVREGWKAGRVGGGRREGGEVCVCGGGGEWRDLG
jgi:hypothetical protein